MSFTRLDASDFVISADSVTAPAWSNEVTTLTSFFTSSGTQAGQISGSYYVDVYNGNPTGSTSAVQFSIAYGHIVGSGSAPINSLVIGNSPTRITFGQYRNLIYGDAESPVNFGGLNTNASSLIAIQVDRNRYKESLFPGTFNIFVSGSAGRIQLTDNSNQVNTITYVDGGRIYDIISGSNGLATTATAPAGASAKGYTASGSYGFYLPDIGLIVLNPDALSITSLSDGGVGLSLSSAATITGMYANNEALFQLINKGANFTLNSQETVSSDYVFVRVRSAEYNYTTNPSMIASASNGELIYSNFINSPQTFPTSVGLYNDNNELLAVAKLSKPLTKDFTKEALIRVKLDW
jgi:hypothetical protein